MQSYKGEQLIETQAASSPVELAKRTPPQATHSVIGKAPAQGEEVKINGLAWVVERVKPQHGWMRLRLKRGA